jgi:predicted CoA-binding protein
MPETTSVKEAASEFLKGRRIAVTGVSARNPGEHGANVVYKRLRDRGYEVFAVNPNADEVEGDACFRDLKSIPGGVDGVVIGTSADHAAGAIEECAELGITQAWMHRSVGAGSVSEQAAERGRELGITVIEGGCPLMFDPTADFGHKVMRIMFSMAGKVPRDVRCPAE